MSCKHANAERGQVFEYCPDCGAVRRTALPGKPAEEWHSCARCRLPIKEDRMATWRAVFEVPIAGGTNYTTTVFVTTESDDPTMVARHHLARSIGKPPEELIHKLTVLSEGEVSS